MRINAEDRQFYHRLRIITALNLPNYQNSKILDKISQEDTLQFCRYGHPSLFSFYRHTKQVNIPASNIKDKKEEQLRRKQIQFLEKITKIRESSTSNSCLHVAALSNNYALVKFLVENPTEYRVDVNSRNVNQENALMVNLKHNREPKTDKISAFLLRWTDPSATNKQGKRAYEINQAVMNPSRARILQILRKLQKQCQ